MTEEGYEHIYDWQVSLAIPCSARNVLKADFERWINGEVPHSVMIGHLHGIKIQGHETRMSTDITLLQQVWDEKVKEIKKIMLTVPELDKAFAEYCLIGSTIEVPPNPFITFASYLRKQPHDVYERVVREARNQKDWLNTIGKVEGAIMNGYGYFWGIDPYIYWIDPDKNRYFADGKNPTIAVKYKINLETRISYIDRRVYEKPKV
ncbi:MAG: hypothetical protein WC254_00565 [Candidatus Woesearchaeota archaeon]|jgi:hypothetical protein